MRTVILETNFHCDKCGKVVTRREAMDWSARWKATITDPPAGWGSATHQSSRPTDHYCYECFVLEDGTQLELPLVAR